MTMWSAVSLRMRDHGSTRSPSHGSTPGPAGGCRGDNRRWRQGPATTLGRGSSRLDEAEDVFLGDAAGVSGTRNRTDIDVVLGCDLPDQGSGLPPQPILRRLGAVAGGRQELEEPDAERTRRPGPDMAGGADGAVGLARLSGDRRRRLGRRDRLDRLGRRGGVAAPFSVSIRATTVCTGTVWPSCTRISASTPASGAGISASTLSVEISKIGSSRLTSSPTFFIQRDRVPSAMDSPIWGMMTSILAMTRSPSCSVRRKLLGG